MIDFREVLIPYIKSKLSNIDVRDGSSTFKQPTDNYVTYYILSEIVASFQNETITNTVTEEATYTPLTIASVRISVRGSSSYVNCKTLWNGLDTITNKKSLSDSGVYFMGKGSITQLPTDKNTRLQEGYLFTLTFSYDNTFTETTNLSEDITTDGN
tara:strand:- start:1917 stop:2384 length:468 start_codon:yes stop_codon:yes gene_type:complete